MGLLDDAIREHLELKRRRGGDPSEIERAERDALGPVRREPEPIQPAAFDETDPAEAELAPGFAGEHEVYEPPFDEGGHDPLSDPYALDSGAEHGGFADPDAGALGSLPHEPEPPLAPDAVGTEPEPPAAPEPFGLRDDEDPWVAPAPDAPPLDAIPHEDVHEDPAVVRRHDPLPEPSEPPTRAPREHDSLSQETAEYRVEHAHGEQDDPLEETPEFLQDTPDHDRLWFEQRPPRDFDFDK